MVDFTIKDGCGSGNRAKVNSENRLLTSTINRTSAAYSSQDNGQSYMVSTFDTAYTLTATTTGGYFLYLKNNDDDEIVINRIIGNADGSTRFELMKNVLIGTIGNNNTHTSVNLNYASSNTNTATCYNWDETGDGMTGISGGTLVGAFTLPAAGLVDLSFDGDHVIPKGSNFAIKVTGIGGTREVGFFINFFFLGD